MRKYYYIVPLLIFINYNAYGQYKFDKLWAKIENLELEGKTRSAAKKIDQIYTLAQRENNQSQIIKSFLYKAKYILLLEEKAANNVYHRLLSEVKNTAFPTKNILESILAKSLEHYLDSNAYKIGNRTETDTTESLDYRTWDINTLRKQIHLHYQNSLDRPKDLVEINDAVFSELLKFGDNDRQYRNTLYDLLANRAIRFYDAYYYYFTQKEFPEILPSYYSIPTAFIREKIDTTDVTSSIKNTLALYQNIEKAHFASSRLISYLSAAKR